MRDLLDFLLQLLSQFFGGPGVMENNLVRFIMPAILWGVLLSIAWSRQREHNHNLPREKLLVWGFGLGVASAILMTIFVSLQMLQVIDRDETYALLIPLDRALSMASILVVAGAYIRYILDDERLAHTYLWIGLGATLLCLVIALWQWPSHLAVLTEDRFHTVWISWLFEVFSSILLISAILLLRRKSGWLPNVVTIALAFFLISKLLALVNFGTDKLFNRVICPIGNSFHILAIPLLGYVYLREQSIEKQQAEKDLEVYRHHLEDLIDQRTAEIMTINEQLKQQILERKQAEVALEKLNHRHELILESAGEGICGIDHLGRFSFVNPAAAHLLGYQVNELVGKPCHVLCHHTHADHSHYPEENCPIFAGYARGIPSHGDNQLFWRKDHTSFPVLFASTPTYENETLTGAVVVFRDITERKQAEAEISRRNMNLAAQISIANTLSRSLNLETVLDNALDAVLSVAKMEVGLIFLWDTDQEELILRSCRGSILQEGAKGLKPDWPCCGAISSEAMNDLRVVVRAVSVCADQLANSMIVRERLETLVSVPLISNSRAVGALTLGSRQKAPVHPPELELLSAIGQQIGMAVENANLVKQIEWAAALEERQRIAADMHDGLAQTVSLLGLQIEEAMALISNTSHEAALEELATTRDTVEQISVEVRRSIASLHKTPQLRQSFQEHLSRLPEQLLLEGGLPVNLIFKTQTPIFLPREQVEQALPIVQEALLNAQRHSRSHHIALILESQDQLIRITVEDDGQGFNIGEWWKNSHNHFGLSIMHSRAARIGAQLEISSTLEKGTCVTLTLPVVAGARTVKPIAVSKPMPSLPEFDRG